MKPEDKKAILAQLDTLRLTTDLRAVDALAAIVYDLVALIPDEEVKELGFSGKK